MDTNITTIDMLPNDVLLEIFSYLCPKELSSSVVRVCRKWHDIGHHPSLWKEINFGVYSKDKLSQYVSVVQLHPSIRSIVCDQADEQFLDNVVTICPNLRKLVVSFIVDMPSYTMERLVAACPNIEFLDFSDTEQWSWNFQYHPIIYLQQLKTLKLINCNEVPSSFISKLTSMCRHLECLHLNCKSVPQEVIHDLLLILKPKLKDLFIKCEKLDTTMKNIIHDCQKLEKLGIKVMMGPINMQLSHLCTHQVQLKELNLSSCSERLLPPEVTGRVFQGTTFPNVVHLFYKEVSGNDLLAEDIIVEFPHLEKLSLFVCTRMTNAGLTNIIEKCIHLQELNVNSCRHITSDCFQLQLEPGRHDIHVEFVISAFNVQCELGHLTSRSQCIFCSSSWRDSPNFDGRELKS
ncbi:F-box domain [Trinorchestia longiramus]|nr:F-box domain [Trinorchestia longiramus]